MAVARHQKITMAITIDFPAKVVTVPQADCTFVSGTFYRLPTKTVFKAAVDALVAGEEGMPFQPPIDHNTEYTVVGVTFAPKIEMINSYMVEFTPNTQWSVELTESNNNIWDVGGGILVQNQVQVIPTNTAGLISSPKIDDLHELHGLKSGDPLAITDGARTTSNISQTIVDDGTTTTVTRT